MWFSFRESSTEFSTIDHDKQGPNISDNLKEKKGKVFHFCKYVPGYFAISPASHKVTFSFSPTDITQHMLLVGFGGFL